MRIREFGDDPEVAVVAAIHGDEPCGPRAVEALLDDPPTFRRPVKFIVANERALDRGVRYLDDDLNRAFPGDEDAESHERRLASRLRAELDGCTTLALHSTQSYPNPFALVDTVTRETASICARLPVDAVVEAAGYADGRLIAYPRIIEVECGLQWSDAAAANAERLVEAFLAATDVLQSADATVPDRDVPIFRLTGRVAKAPATNHEVFVENFERVPPGVPFATADGDDHVAEEPFYPILMSAEGYEDVFGYAGDRIGRLADVESETSTGRGGRAASDRDGVQSAN
ncbi:MAG: succinylglutamate desuccinylase/aspartoacylase family protein [Haloplanus sp.]